MHNAQWYGRTLALSSSTCSLSTCPGDLLLLSCSPCLPLPSPASWTFLKHLTGWPGGICMWFQTCSPCLGIRVRQICPKCTEFIIPSWILFQWPCGVPEHFSESTVDLWKWRLTFFWPPLVKYKVKICPNWNFVINLIWNVLCSFTEHFKAAFW